MTAAARIDSHVRPAPKKTKDDRDAAMAFPTIGAAEIFAPLPPRDFLIDVLRIEAGSRCTGLVGEADAGKSKVAQSLAIAAAAGIPWCGVHPVRQTRTLVIDEEAGSATKRQIQRLAAGYGLTAADLSDLDLAIHPGMRLDDPNVERRFRETCRGYGLVIIDSLTGISGELDENSSAIGRKVLMLGRIASDLGLAIVVLHHTSAAGRIRGSTSIPAGFANTWLLSKDGECRCILEHERTPDGEYQPDIRAEILDVEINGDRKAGLSVRLKGITATAAHDDDAADLQRVILEHLRRGPLTGLDDFARELGTHSKKIRAALTTLVATGDVARTGNTRSTRYTLTGRAR